MDLAFQADLHERELSDPERPAQPLGRSGRACIPPGVLPGPASWGEEGISKGQVKPSRLPRLWDEPHPQKPGPLEGWAVLEQKSRGSAWEKEEETRGWWKRHSDRTLQQKSARVSSGVFPDRSASKAGSPARQPPPLVGLGEEPSDAGGTGTVPAERETQAHRFLLLR